MISRINQLFDADSPEGLVQGLEALVGVLRNNEYANNVDVELFFKSEDKLISKLRRMEMREADKNVVTSKLAMLKEAKAKMQADTTGKAKTCQYLPLINWGISFCEGGIVDTELKDLEQKVAAAKVAHEEAKHRLMTTQRLNNDLQRFCFERFFEERKGFMTE